MSNTEAELPDPLQRYPYYVKALAFYDAVIDDTQHSHGDLRWRVIVSQLVRAAGSISANIEEGYGRGTAPEFIHRLRIARGEALECSGWYRRAQRFLPPALIQSRRQQVGEIIALLTANIKTLDKKAHSDRPQ